MDIKTTPQDQATIIDLSGRFDASVAETFKETVENKILSGNYKFVVDLAQVNYIDSGGLGSMVTALRQARERGGDILLAEPSDKLRSLFALTRLTRLFDIYDDREIAVNTICKPVTTG